jgi:hypothetical protein
VEGEREVDSEEEVAKEGYDDEGVVLEYDEKEGTGAARERWGGRNGIDCCRGEKDEGPACWRNG